MIYRLPDPDTPNTHQLGGTECIYCDNWASEPTLPVGHLRGALVFAHPDCAEEYRIGEIK